MTTEQMAAEIARLTEENERLRRLLAIQEWQMKNFNTSEETRRLRAKIAEWEGSTQYMNGGYYHGSRFIRPYQDDEQ